MVMKNGFKEHMIILSIYWQYKMKDEVRGTNVSSVCLKRVFLTFVIVVALCAIINS